MADLSDQVRAWRHRLHEHPETGFAEHETSRFVAATLESLGLEVTRGIGGTGVVASLNRGTGAGAIALRADMDGLPIPERSTLAYRSRNEGVMHACGHDGHMAVVLGAAAALVADGAFDGTVRFVFQPAEEHGLGARAMLDDDLLDRFPVDAFYGLHNAPGLTAGHLHTRAGAIMASEDDFEIRITGRGGHASQPQLVVDPLVVAAEIVLALQTIVARNVDPAQAAVVSCTELVTDGARNAIPTEVVVRGDTRSFDAGVQSLLERRMRDLATGIATAHGARCTVTYTHEFEPTVNDPVCTAAAVRAATAAVGAGAVDADCLPFMGSEDFGVFARAVPGCFTFLGNGTEPGRGGTPLHSHDYDLNDEILDVGVRFYTALVHDVLAPRDAA
jgi:amidohydrolase